MAPVPTLVRGNGHKKTRPLSSRRGREIFHDWAHQHRGREGAKEEGWRWLGPSSPPSPSPLWSVLGPSAGHRQRLIVSVSAEVWAQDALWFRKHADRHALAGRAPTQALHPGLPFSLGRTRPLIAECPPETTARPPGQRPLTPHE